MKDGDILLQEIERSKWRVINIIAWLLSEPATGLHYQISKN